MKNILVPCDFSKPSEEAFKFAVSIASQSNGNVHVLHVIDITYLNGNPTLANAYAFNVGFIKEIEMAVEQKFQVMRGRFAPLTMSVTFKHTLSSLTAAIQNYIRENKIDLVLMGTRGQGNATLGSNTEKVVRNSPVPVLSVRTAPAHIRSIVVPLLPDQTDTHFIHEVKRLQDFFSASIDMLYINTPMVFKSDSDSYAKLNELATENRFSNCSTHVRSDYTVESGIANFAKEKNADLIALGTHARKGLAHYIIGSTAEDIVNHIKIPIWTLRLE